MKFKRRKRSISLSDDDDDGMKMDDESRKESSQWPQLHSKFPRCSQPPRRDVEEFAQSYGIKVKFGLFTKKEDGIILNNFKEFCQDLKIEDNEKVRLTLLGFAKKDDDDFIKELGKEEMAKVYDFKFRLAKGLDERLIGSVYQRARKILAPFKRADHLSKDERNKIVESFHGTPRKFVESALEKKIDPKTLRRLVVRKVDPENKTYKVGVWNRKEEKKLIKCLRKRFPTIDNVYEIKCRNISWATISKKVKTRSPDQCRNHFIYLKQKQRPLSFSDESFEESNDSEEDEESKISKDDQDHIIQTKELTSMDQDQNLDQGLNKNDKQDQHNGVNKDNEDNEENDDSEDNEESDDSDENDEDQKEQSDENESGKQEDPEVDIREPDTTPVQRDTTDPPENGTGQSTEAEVSNTLIESNGQLERIEETENLNHKEQEENIEEDKHDHENNIDKNGDTGNDSMEGVFTQINETASFETNSPSPMKSKKRKKKKKKKIEDGTTMSNQDHESHVEPTTATALATATEGDSDPLSPRSTGEIDPKMISDGPFTSPRKSRKRKKKSKQGKDNSTSNETSTPLKNSEEPKEFDQINASQGSEWGVKSIKSPEINKRSKKANRKRKKSSLNLTL